eukprot:NODE_2433_length_1118_cov_2483.966324_g179_i1.p1 GENE.NODE_2433_length_1118_cov_2483.966324_g179_i1~~NODE_2433_length_1118_cov_2483.966324_g179_i1.p1  ORF type:complete len:267 (+),score=119.69 NODE_2433_length_1118_cov_2483.966324_g179_i1:95-895(+)
MPAKPAAKGKKAAPKPGGKKGAVVSKKAAAPKSDPRMEKRPKNFAIGNDIPPKRDLTRFVRWPRYVWRQRRVRVLQARLKIPSAVNQFSKTIDQSSRDQLFQLCAKYKPESKKERQQRLKAIAAAKAKKQDPDASLTEKRVALRSGIQCVTRLVEQKRAKLVLIAHDVAPLELVVWLPTLCKAQGIPYAIVKGKARLGQLTGFKTATCVAFEKIRPADTEKFDKLAETCEQLFNDKYEEVRRQHGGLTTGRRTQEQQKAKARRMKK